VQHTAKAENHVSIVRRENCAVTLNAKPASSSTHTTASHSSTMRERIVAMDLEPSSSSRLSRPKMRPEMKKVSTATAPMEASKGTRKISTHRVSVNTAASGPSCFETASRAGSTLPRPMRF
jgi:hypothetical protein